MKICALDVDGVLAQYPEPWIDFVNKKTRKKFTDLYVMKNTLTFSNYKALKTEYRNSGEKRKIKANKNASELTKTLKQRNYIIVLLTARPIYENKKVLEDTLFWLKKNKIFYDLIFNGKDKHIKLLKYFKEIDFMVEDNHSIANSIAQHNFKVYLMDNIYNRKPLHKKVVRIYSLKEITEVN